MVLDPSLAQEPPSPPRGLTPWRRHRAEPHLRRAGAGQIAAVERLHTYQNHVAGRQREWAVRTNRTMFDKDIDGDSASTTRRTWRCGPLVQFCECPRGFGFKHYSADAVLHQIRWHHQCRVRADGLQDQRPFLEQVRALMAERLSPAGFFELRRIA